jgi:hypothetical protein
LVSQVRVNDADLRVNGFAHNVLLTFTFHVTKASFLRTATRCILYLDYLGPYAPECVEVAFSEVGIGPDHYRKGSRRFRPIAL